MRTFLILAALSSMLLLPTAASAHAQLDKSSVPAGSAQVLTVTALSERPLEHNTDIEVKLPDGFTGTSCHDKANWSCTISQTGAGTIVHFARTSGSDFLLDDTYAFEVVVTSTPGDYVVPIIQTYSSGEEVRWTNPDPDGEGPAPHLEVTTGGPVVDNDDEAPSHDAPGGDRPAHDPPAEEADGAGDPEPRSTAQPPAAPADQSADQSAGSSSDGRSPQPAAPRASAAGSTATSRPAAQPASPAASTADTPGDAPAAGPAPAPATDETSSASLTDQLADASGGDDDVEFARDDVAADATAGLVSGEAASADAQRRGGVISVALVLLLLTGGAVVLVRRRT